MKILFFGSGEDSLIVLSELYKKFDISGCITKIPKPKGRKRIIVPTPVESYCKDNDIEVRTVVKIDEDIINWAEELKPDAGVVASFGLYIPSKLFLLPVHRTFNIHPSLLPEYRGAAPIRYVFFDNKKETGVTIHYTEEELDAGTIISQKRIVINEDEDYGVLSKKLFLIGSEMICGILNNIEKIKPYPQDSSKATFAPSLKKEDLLIDLDWAADKIIGRIKGLSPSPGARVVIDNETWKVFKAEIVYKVDIKDDIKNGTIVYADTKRGLNIKCKDSIIRLIKVQRPGKKVMDDVELLRGYKIERLKDWSHENTKKKEKI